MKIIRNRNEKYQYLIKNYVIKNREQSQRYKTLSLLETFYISIISCIIIHAIYSVIFFMNSLRTLAYYNLGSVIFYIGLYFIVKKGCPYCALKLMHMEIVLYTILGTVYIGWESGFSYLMLSLLATIWLAEFKNSFTKYIIGAIEVVVFFILKIYCMYYQPIYINEVNKNFINAMFIFNAAIYVTEVLFFAINSSRTTFWLQRKLIEQNITLNNLATVDQLTKLYNRRSMDEHLEKTYAESLLTRQAFSIAICDIDDFKSINDTYGHQCGDFVLYTIASIVSNNIRETDIACRWGGEELLIIFPNADIKNAVNQTEQIRNAIQDNIFSYNNYDLKITMTFGVCNSSEFETLDGLITEADRLLYSGKKNGKNCVIY